MTSPSWCPASRSSTDLRLLVNTTTGTPTFTVSGGSIVLPAGPYLRLSATAVTLTIAGQSVTGLAVDVERTVVDGAAVTRVTISGGTLELSTGATVVVRLTGVNGSLVLGAKGLAGRLSATVALAVPGLTGGTVSVAVNTSAVAALGLPAGPYLRVEIVGAALEVAGQTLRADLAVERATDDGGQPVVVAALTHLTLAVTAGGQPVVSITDGSGVLVVTAAGVAARVTGTVAVTVPGVALSGTLDLRFNGTTSVVNRVVTLGGTQVTIALPAAATSAGYLRFQGTGIVLTVAGQRLTGDVVVERSGTSTHVVVTGASLELGGGLASVTGASADLTVEAAGVHGTFTGAIAFTVPSVSLAATVTVDLDTRAATRHVRVQAAGVDLVLAGQTLHGDVVIEQTTSATGQAVVTVAVVNTLADATDLLTLRTGSTTILAVAAATGVVVIGPGGVAGSLDVQSFSLSLGGGVTLTADSITVEVNTGRSAVSHTVTVGGTTVALALPAGPFVSVALLGAKLTLGSGGPQLAGSFAFRQGTAGDGSAITVVAATDVSVDVTVGGDGARLVDGSGAFVILTGGVAGYLTGKVTIAAGPVGAGADILLRVNTTTGPVDTSADVGGRTLSVKFTAGNVFQVSLSNLTLTIADVLTIEGSITFSDTTIGGQAAQVFAGDGLTIFLGRGPAKLDTGETNPLATGVLLTNGRIGLIRIGSTWALTASGTVSIIGVAGVTLTGTVSARVNTTGLVIDESLEMPGGAPPVAVTFSTAAPVLEMVASGATLAFGGQSLTGTFSFAKRGDDVVVAASAVSVSLGSTVSVTQGSGVLLLTPAGIAGRLSAQIQVTVPGITIGSGLSVSISSIAAPVSTSVDVAGATLVLDLPAGPYLRVAGSGLTVTVQGQSLTADVVLERATVGGATVTTIGLNRVDLSIGAGGNGVRITGGSGLLLVTAAGVAGRISGALVVTLPAGTTLTGDLTLAVNTTTLPVAASVDVGGTAVALDVKAGPYVRFEGTGMVLTVLGQSLRGDLVVERSTSYGANGVPGGTGPDADTQTVRLAMSNVSLALGGATPVLSVTNGAAVLLLGPTGLAGRITGTITLAVPSVSLTGALAVEVNTTSGPVVETFTVGAGAPVSLDLPTGPYLRVAGTDIVLTVLGQTLTGTVVITRTTDAAGAPVLDVLLSGVTMRLGGTAAAPVVTLTQVGTAQLRLTSAGLAGHVTAAIALNVPDVSVTGEVEVSVNTTGATVALSGATLPAGPYLRVAATDLELTVLGQLLTADVVVEQLTTSTGAKVVRVGLTDASVVLLGTALAPKVALLHGHGLLVVAPTGVAGSFAGDLVLDLGGALRLTGAFGVEVNTTGDTVSQVLQVGTSSVELDVPAGPFVRITGTGISLVVGGQTLTGDVSIERALSLGADGVVGGTLLDADTTVIKVAATNVSLAIGDGTRTVLTLTGGEALLVSRGTGIAASLSGTVALRNVPGVTLSGTFLVEINTLTTVVDEAFTVGGTTRVLELPAATSATTPLIRVRGQDVVVQLGDGLALGADITVTKVGTTLTVTVANGRIVLGNAASPLATLTGVNGTLVLTSAGIYGQVAANLQLDVPSVTLTASFKVRFNTTTTDQSITVPETATLTPGFRVVATGVTLGIAGQTLGGNIVIERIVGPGPTFTPEVRIAVADLTLTLGSAVTVLASHQWNGALLITSSGVAATFSGSLGSGTVADPYVFTLGTGITVGGAVALVVNTSPVAVDEAFTVELPDGTSTPIHLVAPAGPAFQVSISGTLTVGTVVFTGSFVVAQSTRARLRRVARRRCGADRDLGDLDRHRRRER